MADKPTDKTKKRLVKNPETFRERAVKANIEKPNKLGIKLVWSAITKILSLFFSPIINGLKKFFGLNAFKFLRKPLNFIGKILLPVYFRKSFQELKLVTWPDWKTSRQLTFAVLVFAVIFGSVIASVDWGLDKVFKNLLLK